MSRVFAVLLPVVGAVTFVLVLTGMQVRTAFSTQPPAQAQLLVHMALGLALVPLVAGTLACHPGVSRTPGWLRRLAGDALGTLAAAGLVAAAASGIWLAVWVGPATRVDATLAHRWAGQAFAGTLVIHVLLAWTLRHGRGAAGRDGVFVPASLAALSAAAVLALVTAAGAPRIATARPVPPGYTRLGTQPKTLFSPGQQRTTHERFIPVEALSGSFSCGASGCHTQIVREWSSSMHRHAAGNDHYRAQVRLRIHDVPVKPHAGARFCSACHEPIAVLSGEVDPGGRGIEFSENLDEGISCVTCHKLVAVPNVHGNGSYVIDPPRRYLMQGRGGLADAAARAAIRAKPAAHTADLMRPLLRRAEACAPCHGLFLEPAVNPRGSFQVQQTFDEWRHTPFATDAARRQRCQDCHMRLVSSTDPAARHGKHRSHRFLGANTMRPWLDGDTEQLEATRRFLQAGLATLEIRAAGALSAGQPARLTAVLTNHRVGHRLPSGTVDMHDFWIELVVDDRTGRRLFTSGAIDPQTLAVDPAAATYRSIPENEAGEWLYRRDMWNMARFQVGPNYIGNLNPGQMGVPATGDRHDFFNLPSLLFMRTLWPESPDERHFDLALPADVAGPLTVRARLRYRKANQRFTDWVFNPAGLREGSGYRGPRRMRVSMPVTDLVSHRVVLPVGAAARPDAPAGRGGASGAAPGAP
jgi:hypothetical protein